MKTIWAVEHGEYSDYRIVGVFSSQENAQKVADAINATRADLNNRENDAKVVEWPLDPDVDVAGTDWA